MNLNMQRLFDSLKDGLLIVSSDALEVLYANQAARTILPLTIGKPLSGAWMHSQINAIQRGYLKPPLTFEIDLPRQNQAAEQIQVTLLSSPVGSDFIAVLKNITADQMYENVISNLAEMLDCDFRAPMQDFLSAVNQMHALFEPKAEESWALREAVAEVSRQGDSLKGRLQQIGLLASTFKEAPMRGEERITVPKLINDILISTRSLLTEHGIRVSFSGISDKLPVIYGSRDFLVQALAGYLRHLIQQIDLGVNILVSAKIKGNFMLLSITNYGQSSPPDKSRHVLLPLLGAGKSQKCESLGLTLPLCKRVVELSGGSLQFGEDAGEVSKITFELPIGAPSTEKRELGLLQAQRYAQDFHTLMQRYTLSTH
ncbi:MAG: ATP-binding protein [Betaproteobacteria bacterium]